MVFLLVKILRGTVTAIEPGGTFRNIISKFSALLSMHLMCISYTDLIQGWCIYIKAKKARKDIEDLVSPSLQYHFILYFKNQMNVTGHL